MAVTGTFVATGQSDSFLAAPADKKGEAWRSNISLSGTWVATVALERSFDGGTTWFSVKEYTANASEVFEEPEAGTLYRLNCSAYTSGTVTYRLSR